MRLLTCYVEGYGKLKGQEYTFSDGITGFYQENGEGKTTLASFLKAMFFGLKPYRKGSTEFCDREHFYPFEGGLFGGNLTFEMDGKEYKIERFFGEKSEVADTVKLYENGKEREIPEGDIGKWAFGVDKESFERTAFLESGDIELKATSSIHAQLNRFLEGGEEDVDLGGALSALEKAAKRYKKSRAGMDKITEVSILINELNDKIENAERIRRALTDKYARATALEAEIESLNGQIVRAQEQNEKCTQAEHYESLCAAAKKAESTLCAVEAKYPNGLPTLAQANETEGYVQQEKELRARAEGLAFSQKEEEKLVRLSEAFVGGTPTEEELFAVEQKMKSLAEAETEAKLAAQYIPQEEERRLARTFAHGAPEKEALSETERRVEVYKGLQKEYAETPALVQVPAADKSGKKYALLAALAALLCVGGAVGMIFNPFVGGGILLVGGGLLLAAMFGYLNKKSGAQSLSAENTQKQRLEKELREIEDCVKAVLLPYGYASGNGLAFDFASLQKDAAAYERMQAAARTREEKLDYCKQAVARAEGELTAFFRRYGLAGDSFVKLLSDLRVRLREYADLSARKKQTADSLEEIKEKLVQANAFISAYRSQYATVEFNLSQIAEDIRTAERLRKEEEENRLAAARYQAEKGLSEWQGRERIELAPLQARLSDCQTELGRLGRAIEADEAEADELERYEEEKREAEARLKEYKQKYKLLTEAGELLQQAEGRLRDKYVKPFKDEFLHYAEIIERALGEKVKITKDFELRFERNGIERSEKHLSTGQRSVCALCFRLALIKNMYRDRVPFLILDDPFTSLDETHIQRVKQVLLELSKEMQMIYFTCHESRRA